MIKKIFKSFTVFLVILGIFFSNMPFDALIFFIDSYQKTSGIVDKIWLVEQNHNSDVVDKFVSLRNISDKLRIHEAHASTFVAVSNYNSSGSASALVNKPAGTVDDDIMFALIMRNNNGAVNSVPAGWNLIANHQYSTTYHQMLYWKLAAGEGTNYTWGFASSGKTAITIAAYRGGFDTANPIDVVSNTEFITTPSTTVRAASMNVSAPNSSLIWFGTLYSTTVRRWTKPAIPTMDWVENYDGGATTSDFSRTIDSMVWAGFGATGNMDGIVVTGGTTTKHAFAVALKPIPMINPDATSVTYQVGGDGARSGYSATITGTNFGTVFAGSRANCAGGAGTGCVRFIVGGNAIIADADVTAWSDTSISFTIDNLLASYGGLASLQVVSAGASDSTPLNFYIYPNITSILSNNAQIGDDTFTISGNHFGVSAGTITINTKTATVGTWGENSLSNVKIPGQEGSANITGKIQLTRADAKTSNQYPAGNFTILAPSVSSSSSSPVQNGSSTVVIHFNGLGIDTDTSPPNTRPIFYLKKTGQTPIQGDTVGSNYGVTTAYQDVYATFDLSGVNAVAGTWDLEITNMDLQVGTCAGCLVIEDPLTVTSITPDFGLSSENKNIVSIGGTGFKNGATAKLNNVTDILSSPAFTFSDSHTLLNGAFNLNGQAIGFWDVVVTNPGPVTATFSNGFEIRSAVPSVPANIYQFKNNSDVAQPPTTNIAVGEGIGGQTNIYFRMDITGGLTGALNPYTPQVEVKQVGDPFDGLPGSILSGSEVVYDGITPALGWVNVIALQDGAEYHWRARASNSAGQSAWVAFGGNIDRDPQPSDRDVYIDATAPTINYVDCAIAAPAASITDLSALIQWNTSDATSGASSGFSGGNYAKVQVDYKKSTDVLWSSTVLSAWEGSPHQVDLAGLTPATNYAFKMKAQDYVGNERVSAECSFTTTSSRPIKTVEFFILQETAQNLGGVSNRIAKDFGIYIPESPGTSIAVKSAFIEIAGISSDGAQSVNVELRTGTGAGFTEPGTSYSIDSIGTTTPFTILFDASNNTQGNQSMVDDIAQGATPYSYTLFLSNTSGINVSAFSAKLVITYSYAL